MTEFKTILINKADIFLESIKKFADINQSHHFSNKSGGFPIFFENPIFNEQSFFEERIENSIWRYLVNDFFKEIFSDQYCQTKNISIEWCKMHPQITYSFVERTEEKYALEFIITKENTRVGYRYTNCYWLEDKMDKVFQHNKLDMLRIVDFSSEATFSFMHPIMVSRKYSDLVNIISLKDFITAYFSDEEYLMYVQIVQDVIKKAKRYIGLQTIPNLTHQYLPFFIDDFFAKVSNDNYSCKSYEVLCLDTLKKDLKKRLKNKNDVISNEDYIKLDKHFYDEKRYFAMGGNEDFAHSFITSEYLYQTLKMNNSFDFTAIVSGYLKSIEQFLYKIMEHYLNNPPDEKLWIKCCKSDMKRRPDEFIDGFKGRNKRHVLFKEENIKYFDTTFTPLVNFIDDFEKGWSISTEAKNKIIAYLLTYCAECRNEHFHKDNINNIYEVDIIRSNTILLFYYLLGGLRLTGNISEDYKVLGIVDRSFEDMYHAITKKSSGGDYFILEYGDGDSILVALPMNHGKIEYDKNGLIKEKAIRFVKIKKQRKIVLTVNYQLIILTTNNFQKGRCYGKTYSRHNIHGHQ